MTATKYTFQTSGVCSQEISFSIDEKNRIHNVHLGADATQVATLLKGNDCGGRGTSCADQLSRAITAALSQK